MGAGRAMSSRGQFSSGGGLPRQLTKTDFPSTSRQFGKSKNRSSGENIAQYVPEQRSSQEQADAVKQAKEKEQSDQWNRATSEMKTPNVMYDDRNQTEIAGKYARDTERAAPDSSYSRSRAGRDLRM